LTVIILNVVVIIVVIIIEIIIIIEIVIIIVIIIIIIVIIIIIDEIKINIIDIVSLIYSDENKNNSNDFYLINKEINSLLKTLLYNEKNIIVIAHIINAFMDIYKWDDEILNKNLKNSEILILFKNNLNELKNRKNSLFKTNEINENDYVNKN
jgi:hypothetical protein